METSMWARSDSATNCSDFSSSCRRLGKFPAYIIHHETGPMHTIEKLGNAEANRWKCWQHRFEQEIACHEKKINNPHMLRISDFLSFSSMLGAICESCWGLSEIYVGTYRRQRIYRKHRFSQVFQQIQLHRNVTNRCDSKFSHQIKVYLHHITLSKIFWVDCNALLVIVLLQMWLRIRASFISTVLSTKSIHICILPILNHCSLGLSHRADTQARETPCDVMGHKLRESRHWVSGVFLLGISS